MHLARGIAGNVTLKHLELMDNGIDMTGEDRDNCVATLGVFQSSLMTNKTFVRLNLKGNMIGEEGGAAVLALYTARKDAALPTLNIRVTHRLSGATYEAIDKKTSWSVGGVCV